MSVCKGPMKSVNPYEVTYVSIEQEKRTRSMAARTTPASPPCENFLPTNQKQFDDFNRQACSSVASRRGTAEQEYRQRLTACSKRPRVLCEVQAIQQAHAEKVATGDPGHSGGLQQIWQPRGAGQIGVDNLDTKADSGAEKVEIPAFPWLL